MNEIIKNSNKFRDGKEPFDLTIIKLAVITTYNLYMFARYNKSLKKSNSITVTVQLYYNIDGLYFGNKPFDKMVKYDTIVFGKPITIPITYCVRNLIMRNLRICIRDIASIYILNTPISYSYASKDLTVKVISTSFEAND